jgi:hypothetical protein
MKKSIKSSQNVDPPEGVKEGILIPILPIRWVIPLPDGFYATESLQILLRLFYFEN